MRGPQGVWIQNGKLYVADTQNNRVLIYNQIPGSNGAAADVVLGQPNLTTFVEPDLTQQTLDAAAQQLLNPVAVSSDGVRLFVTDLGYNRVLVWNNIPDRQPAGGGLRARPARPDQRGAPTTASRWTPTIRRSRKRRFRCCARRSNGTDTDGNPTYPNACNSTLNFPRFALAAGDRLFIADGGNDRVLVYENMPTQSGAGGGSSDRADRRLGQPGIGRVGFAAHAAVAGLGRHESVRERCL